MQKVLTPEQIAVNITAENKHLVLEKIAELAWDNELLNSREQFLAGLEEREQEFSCGIGNGFAIPHCKNAAVREPAILVLTLTDGVDWDSLDGEPVTCVMALAVPDEQAGTTHLKLLSKVGRLLMRETFTTAVKKASTQQELFEVIHQGLEGEL